MPERSGRHPLLDTCPNLIYGYIYIIYTPNLGLGIAVFDREREQGRFKGSNEGAKGRSKGAVREHKGAQRGQERALREQGEHYRAVQGRSKWEPEMEPSVSAGAAILVF